MRNSLLSLIFGLVLMGCAEARTSVPAEGEAISAAYPEGPLYVGETLYYADMGEDRVMRRVGGQNSVFYSARRCGPTAIAQYGEGFLILCHIGARVVSVDANGNEVRRWEQDSDGRAFMDPNDVSADGHGGVYFSDPGVFTRRSVPHGFVVHLSADGVARSVASGLWYPNGVFVDHAANVLYVDEHMTGRVWRYEIGENGALGARAVFADLSTLALPPIRFRPAYAETGPDGLEIGPNGDFYIAQYGAGRIVRLSPAGALRDVIETPARYVTNIAFAPNGGAAVTGPFEMTPPYRGEVRFFTHARLTRRAN